MTILTKRFRYFLVILIPFVIMAVTMHPSIKKGDKAPDFTLPGENGANVSLADYQGKIVVIHIWSHTCSHCRINNQTLPAMMTPYKDANLAYLMIDINSDTTAWKSIIKEDKLKFAIHAMDADAQSMLKYDVKGTPCINIADEKGNLLAVNCTSAQLKKILKQRFP